MSILVNEASKRLERLPLPTALEFASGARIGAPDPQITLRLPDEKALRLLTGNRLDAIADAIVEGKVGIEGRMRDLMTLTAGLIRPMGAAVQAGWLRRAIYTLRSARMHTRARDAGQISFHYDVSDDFYQLWLDPRRVYSCAYFADPSMTLAQAQEAKLDLICRKLDLKAGERFLDVGAGWGGLLLWAAENYGVTATGITLSRNQHAHVNRLIHEKGLERRVTMELRDYRDLPDDQPYDKIASVGMFEHVGRVNLPIYFRKLRALLRPGGLLMNHGITSGFLDDAAVSGGLGNFIEKYIFPGGELFHISHVQREMAGADLEVVDTESLRPHYARTLWAWSDGLEACLPEAERILIQSHGEDRGHQVLRAFRLYLAGCAMAFEEGWVSLHQILATRPDGNMDSGDLRGAQSTYPFRRGYMYANRP
ncbi:cyclopropane-fatty-acyl-phospholipid synthase [Gemmobacter megaterium]|uniref:Cyclopropane-fatty-acyl-phospholipid synthase n=1 Tax=Gemmobacter megaterium TaxID=1086013 RepID=A0A1N7M4L6_9RHOB|nr:class I SAM-dependent methyltransferase [Gemmobacter megaterium]GGE08888.1 cyclopropane-fatty-acyl-phospholipid synthase [Gemmobacter megaterium]SIS81055.1 cyclopropane-fatty-acyl-phospholipid synthase [Gemmobacter megaterium]